MGRGKTKRSWQLIGCEDLGTGKQQRLPPGLFKGEWQYMMPLKEIWVSMKLNTPPAGGHAYLRFYHIFTCFWLEFRPIETTVHLSAW